MMLLAGFLKRSFQTAFVRSNTAHMRILYSTSLQQAAQGTQIDNFEIEVNKNLLMVEWKNGSCNRYPFFYLRDHCRCQKCWHSDSKQRLVDTFNSVQLDVQPKKVELNHDGKTMTITWPDDHASDFEAELLFEKRLSETAKEATRGLALTSRPVQMWDKSFETHVLRIPFNDIMHDDEALYAWMNSVYNNGAAYIVEAPKEPGQLEKLGQRVAYMKPTIYGGKSYLVEIRTVAYNTTYTPHELPSHTDLPYYQYNPGIQLLHCIQQTKSSGGASTLVDGFNAARLLKEQDPGAFYVLSSTPVYHETLGADKFGEYHLRCCRPVILLDATGRVVGIAVNDITRSGWLDVTIDNFEEIYQAHQKFIKILRDPQNIIEYKMAPGDIITIDNQRVLHGRRGYEPSQGDTRTLETGYVDWDEFRSRLLVLAKKRGEPGPYTPHVASPLTPESVRVQN